MASTQQNLTPQQTKDVSVDKHDSGTTEADFEVAQPMHITNSGDPTDERPGVDEKKPIIEKHITRIPQKEDTSSHNPLSSSKHQDHSEKDASAGAEKESLKQKVKKHLPGHHGSESTEQDPEKGAVDFSRQDSGSSDFEVAGFMPMTSTASPDSAAEAPNKKPRLERHISSIPEKDDDLDGEEEKGMSSKLRRKISHIAQND